jgi:hypothetical protein
LMELLHVGIVWDHYVGIVWDHRDVLCIFHDVTTQSIGKAAWVSPFWNAPKPPRPWVHEAFDNCFYRVMHCISNLQKRVSSESFIEALSLGITAQQKSTSILVNCH